MADDPPRTRAARAAAERALIRIVHHYGTRPEFVVLGGLVPELLCSSNGAEAVDVCCERVDGVAARGARTMPGCSTETRRRSWCGCVRRPWPGAAPGQPAR